MLSNSGERWLISITDIPLPRQSSSSSRMRSSTGSGRAPGPALKLCTRLTARSEAIDVLTLDDSSLLNMAELEGGTAAIYLALQDNRISQAFRKAIFEAMRIV
jgi:hypothetical protein